MAQRITENRTWREVGWKSPSNIALVKYWGKNGIQIPMNPSLGFTLKNAFTQTIVYFRRKEKENSRIDFTYLFEGEQNTQFSGRIGNYLNSLLTEFPFLNDFEFRIESQNSFPHSAGIASSASSMSALALCLCEMEQEIGSQNEKANFFQRASHIARLGSGSASRSVYGGFVAWGENDFLPGSSDTFAIPGKIFVHPVFSELQDSVLIINKSRKKVSSSQGHKLMDNHPERNTRKKQATQNFSQILKVLKTGDFSEFARIVEDEALSLHKLMETSQPPFFLMEPKTRDALTRIKEFRNEQNLPLTFTLDAGPNIHLIYPLEIKKEMMNFIEGELTCFTELGKWIDDEIGAGPEKLFLRK